MLTCLLRQHILTPLGMSDSGWNAAVVDTTKLATLYDRRGRVVQPYYTITYPDGGSLTSTHSLALYLRSILNPSSPGAPPPASACDSLLRPQFTADHLPLHRDLQEPNQDLFWAHRRNGTAGHTGGDAGLTSFLFFDPVTRVGKIFVTNTELHEDARSLAQFIAIWKLIDQVQ